MKKKKRKDKADEADKAEQEMWKSACLFALRRESTRIGFMRFFETDDADSMIVELIVKREPLPQIDDSSLD